MEGEATTTFATGCAIDLAFGRLQVRCAAGHAGREVGFKEGRKAYDIMSGGTKPQWRKDEEAKL